MIFPREKNLSKLLELLWNFHVYSLLRYPARCDAPMTLNNNIQHQQLVTSLKHRANGRLNVKNTHMSNVNYPCFTDGKTVNNNISHRSLLNLTPGLHYNWLNRTQWINTKLLPVTASRILNEFWKQYGSDILNSKISCKNKLHGILRF